MGGRGLLAYLGEKLRWWCIREKEHSLTGALERGGVIVQGRRTRDMPRRSGLLRRADRGGTVSPTDT